MTKKENIAPKAEKAPTDSTGRKQEGKYVDLPGAKIGEVVVRFPPEASGFLHIGHAKAALLNQYYQLAFEGKLVFRFDDTNPEKEKEDYEEVIREDVKRLQITPDICSYTSDYFDLYLEKCTELLKAGKAYVDDTAPEIMKEEREQRVESKNRSNTFEKNLEMWNEMQKGTEYGQKCCVRAVIDMTSNNGCMRDPTLYRCKNQKHPRTGDKYKVYPTYDFACPIIDSIEGITHTLRTSEYLDRDVQYYWVLDALGLRKPHIHAYSRLNMTNCVLSKRKLTWFVDNGIVTGWDDPRMPTVRGVLRRGMTVEGLKQFIIAQGSSRAVVFMEWDKIWSFNKKVIDPIATRYAAVEATDVVPVHVVDAPQSGTIEVSVHPKLADLGKRPSKIGQQLFIDQLDGQSIKEGESVTFVNWGNLIINKISKNKEGLVTAVEAKLNLDDKNFKKTYKATWIEASNAGKATFVYYDHLITKAVLGKDDDFKQFVNTDSKIEAPFFVEEDVTKLKKGDIVQILRKGFFVVDEESDPSTIRHVGVAKPVRLISIPDGSTDMNIFPKLVQEWKTKSLALTAAQAQESAKQVQQAKSAGSPADKLALEVQEAGNKVRDLKAQKADKATVNEHVKILLGLKEKYKAATGKDWTPESVKASPAPAAPTSAPSPAGGDSNLALLVQQAGDKVRDLKTQKADKAVVQEHVKILLELKHKFKAATGLDWTPDSVKNVVAAAAAPVSGGGADLGLQVKQAGDKVRELKAQKADKAVIQEHVTVLQDLKRKFKEAFGKEWTPESVSQTPAPAASPAASGATEIETKIKAQGDKIRTLKESKPSKEALQPEIDILQALKAEFKNLTGREYQAEQARPAKTKSEPKAASAAPAKKDATPKTNKATEKKKKEEKPKDEAGKKQTRLGMEVKKSESFPDWYTEVITKAEMIEYYDVSGCYILRPWAFSIWEAIQNHFDKRIKALGVSNCYFPMFVTGAALEKEKDHIADFAPEVAWVTRSGQSEMAEPIAIRPTSETVMYPSFAKWVQSHRDLPIQVNQWCNVVRWEFKNPTPFLRTREFLWQEGHTAFANQDEAVKEVYQILDYYAEVYEYLLAVPVVKGKKTEKEKFPGGDFTTTIEGYISANGRGIQAATSHHLGQNFSKMFDIVFEDPDKPGAKKFAYQNSWGLSTRSIGTMVMVHSDDKGLVLPPRVAAIQAIITPCGITATTTDAERNHLLDECTQLQKDLIAGGIKAKADLRDHVSPGWKFNHWELKGVPLRIELGPKDLQKQQFIAVRRDNGEKITVALANKVDDVQKLLEDIQSSLFAKAKKEFDANIKLTTSWPEFISNLEEKRLLLSPFCGAVECEENIKKDSAKEDPENAGGPLMGAKSLCIPLEQPRQITAELKCIHDQCTRKPQFFTLFGRSY